MMFNKPESEDSRTEPMIHTSKQSILSTTRSRAPATIGPSIQINGDVIGNEDVLIEGRVEGTISLSDNILTVGKEGQIKATVNARIIIIEGKVEGDLKADERVVVQSSGDVHGNIVSPRVTLEDGCKFKGSIDTDVEPSAARTSGSSSRSEKISDIKSTAGATDSAEPARPAVPPRPEYDLLWLEPRSSCASPFLAFLFDWLSDSAASVLARSTNVCRV